MTYLPLQKSKSGLIKRPHFIIDPCRSRPWTSSSDLRGPERWGTNNSRMLVSSENFTQNVQFFNSSFVADKKKISSSTQNIST